ncbi:PP2C family protein-serine/threonine phosphatase [Streptomyces iconiensis]|uniref:PP2C family protein-serine/threonine phosphatase n=1 Tax=Streptomyces iconiensis TaxID=1384038 RepID=A0ABT6ZUS2_9ACTN|nr:PP2C family protein-serine/threonine phosphatase [Streptomyces iconiensis]MDJ1132803.1 PP2C family protein-serine/threonine phosphatase [Streptomyces iconiensis]
MVTYSGHARMLGELVVAGQLSTFDQLPQLLMRHIPMAGWSEARIYISDLQQKVLTQLPDRGDPEQDPGSGSETVPEVLYVDGTVGGRVFQLGEIIVVPGALRDEWWVPLISGGERIGVLRLTGPSDDKRRGTTVEEELRQLAGLVSMMLLGKRLTSDAYGKLVRRARMNIAAEMEWRQMPPRTSATNRVVVSSLMEPAYEVSGDAFDYAFSDSTVHLCVFDAMGHDTASGLVASLAVSTCRAARMDGADLQRTARDIEEAIVGQYGDNTFVTGIIAELDAKTGTLEWVNRGHPAPVIIRDSRYPVELRKKPDVPLGVRCDEREPVRSDRLQPGDRLVLYTDGITEARSPSGEQFGLERFTDFLVRHNADFLPAPETLRRLIAHHLDYHGGTLNDDATALLLEWHGPTPYPPGRAEYVVGLP